MNEDDWPAEQFAFRDLQPTAHRLPRSVGDSAGSVQESWIRRRSSDATVDNPGVWLTTFGGLICLGVLGTRCVTREDEVGSRLPSDSPPDRVGHLITGSQKALRLPEPRLAGH